MDRRWYFRPSRTRPGARWPDHSHRPTFCRVSSPSAQDRATGQGWVVGAAACVALALAACAPSSPSTVPVQVHSKVGPVLAHATCHPSSSGTQVVASGAIGSPPPHRLKLSLSAYSPAAATLDLEGTAHTATLAPGATTWRVTAHITRGYPVSRCVVTATDAETVRSYSVTTTSMAPTIQTGDTVLVAVTGAPSPSTGDSVAFHPPSGTTCAGAGPVVAGRVVGVGGQTVEGARGEVLVDGRPLDEPWLSSAQRASSGAFAPVVVGNGDVFVLGDNRLHGCDSRSFGPLPMTDVLGPVVRTVPRSSRQHATPTSAPQATTPAFTT